MAVATASGLPASAQETTENTNGFRVEALTDFVDDALGLTFTPQHIDSMRTTLRGKRMRINLNIDIAGEMIARCQSKSIPLSVNRYLHPTGAEEFDRARKDGRFSGFILYETASYLGYDGEGKCSVKHEVAAEIGRRMAAGG